MKKFIYLCVILIFFFTGCSNKSEQKMQVLTSEQTTVEDLYGTEVELLENSPVSKEEAVWQTGYDDLKAILTEVTWIAEVNILPDYYRDYRKDEGIVIQIKIAEGENVSEEQRESIAGYVRNTNYFEVFEISYID